MEGGKKGERNTGGEGKGVREGQGKREEWIDGYTCTYICIHTVQLRAHSRREGVERKE